MKKLLLSSMLILSSLSVFSMQETDQVSEKSKLEPKKLMIVPLKVCEITSKIFFGATFKAMNALNERLCVPEAIEVILPTLAAGCLFRYLNYPKSEQKN